MSLPDRSEPPPLLLLCLGPCHGEFYLPLDMHEARVCPNDRDHPVAIYSVLHVKEASHAAPR